MTQTIKIGITGCTGRVGALLTREILSQDQTQAALVLAGGTVREGSDKDGQDIGALNNMPDCGIAATSNTQALFQAADIVIDFTTPDATMKHLDHAIETGTAIIIGTTGLDDAQESKIRDAAATVPVVYAANTSVGVTLLQALVEKAAALLGEDFDIEITEAHHKHKVDAPSGTALALGKAAAAGRAVDLQDKAVYERYGHTGARQSGDIGFATVRGGDVVGEHTVSFFGDGERVELVHKASNRSLFAKGALRAAKWLKTQPAGLYTMKDVLGL